MREDRQLSKVMTIIIQINSRDEKRMTGNGKQVKVKVTFYLTSVVPSVLTRLLSMEADGAPSTPRATVSAPFYGYSKL